MSLSNTSLILEGGTFRTIFTAGILDHFIDENIEMPYVVGISAGAINACSYVAKQPGRTKRVLTMYRHDKRYMGLGNFFTERSYFGLDFAYNQLPNQLDPFDWEAFRLFSGEVEFGVTNAYTGEVEFMDAKEMDIKCTLLQATCAIPVLFPEIKLKGIPYYDGGLAQPIPIRRAQEKGYDKHVLVLTRPKGYRKQLDQTSKWVTKILAKKYPLLADTMLHRAIRYNHTLNKIEEMEQRGEIFVFRPPYALRSFEKNIDLLNHGYQLGHEQAVERMDELRAYLSK